MLTSPTILCDTLNTTLEEDYTEQIAVIDRGECFFETKVRSPKKGGIIRAPS